MCACRGGTRFQCTDSAGFNQEWLASREETTVVVVAHHNVFLALLKVSFLNCEVPIAARSVPPAHLTAHLSRLH